MKYTLLSFLTIALVAGCSKGKLETKPKLELVSTSDLFVPLPTQENPSGLRVVLGFLDKEGDAGDSLIIRRVRTNRRQGCDPQGSGICTLRDTIKMKIPDFPQNSKGEFEINFRHADLVSSFAPPVGAGGRKEPDTLVYRFVVRDRAGNKSDTLVLENVVVER
ncbi:hypothetical protein EPD60_15810 [Flaviaesturariibacter flavus]|uniref:DUF4625 domain-containing protein n=1 Tax=Flaviaesturariibacter flavus TaxID=2502780 RepID=A0A4R1B1W3_9BACT|nr:hypothetical protein [Flaviaesturariibacter flavus]TCJ12022.1 hypothetical protein EPD60_15810 [Flaviaesturariibacter flavus]